MTFCVVLNTKINSRKQRNIINVTETSTGDVLIIISSWLLWKSKTRVGKNYQKSVTEISILSTGNYMRKKIHKSYFVLELLRYKETNMQRNFLLLWYFHYVISVIKIWTYQPENIFFLQKHLSLLKSKKKKKIICCIFSQYKNKKKKFLLIPYYFEA